MKVAENLRRAARTRDEDELQRPTAGGPPARRGNFLRDLPDAGSGEVAEVLLRDSGVRIERIVSSGQASPDGFWYDQEDGEWVMVLRGRAGLEIEGEGEVLEMAPGDWVDLPAHRRHRVAWTADDEPTVWLAIHRPSTS